MKDMYLNCSKCGQENWYTQFSGKIQTETFRRVIDELRDRLEKKEKENKGLRIKLSEFERSRMVNMIAMDYGILEQLISEKWGHS